MSLSSQNPLRSLPNNDQANQQRPKQTTTMYRLATLALLLIASVSAFQSALPVRTAAPKISTTTVAVILSDEETAAILSSASDCAEGECSLDDVDSLISELKQQEKEMTARLDSIMNMIGHLQHINEKEERKTDEVRSFVRDMLRVFDHGGQAFPIGFSGDIGSGPTTAYDALPPKKWKPAEKK